MIRDVGDIAVLRLALTPTGPDTSASVVITSPDGTTLAPPLTPTPTDDRSQWSANLTLTQAGVYQARWTVLGTGAGSEYQTVSVRPTTITGRSYATTGDLANYLGDAPPERAHRMLIRATEVLDDALIGAVYPVDELGASTDSAVRAALADACCAQVQWWMETGDETGAGGLGGWGSVSIGSVTLSRGSGAGGSDESTPSVAPTAVRALRRAGLLPIHSRVLG